MASVGIIFQVNSNLNRDQRDNLTDRLCEYDNVHAVQFNRNNVLSVDYNPEEISSQELLDVVAGNGIEACRRWL